MACLRYVMGCGYMFSSCRLILSMTHLIEGIAKFYSVNNFKDGNCRGSCNKHAEKSTFELNG